MAEFDDLLDLDGLLGESSAGAVAHALSDCKRGTEIAVKRFEATPCREYAVIALEAACRWFDLLRKMKEQVDAPMPLIKRFSESLPTLPPSTDPALKILALAHAMYATTPHLSEYPWDCREEGDRQPFLDKAKAILTYMEEHNDLVLAPY